MSKRQHIKAQRVKKQRNDKLILAGIIAAALVLFGLLILPNLLPKPVIARPNVQGLAMGDPNAPVKIEQFSDFLCSHCADYALNTEEEIVKNYVATGKVYMKFIPTPFMGEGSTLSAEGSYCASDQGKFWEYHDILFQNQANFTLARLVTLAGNAKLDTAAFRVCMESGKYKQQVTDDLVYAGTKNVTGTPSFMVNTQLVYRDTLKLTIDLELANLGK